LDQAHLVPLSLTVKPVLWEFDHTLRLYPMPTTLVLADHSATSFDLTYELGEGGADGKCHVFNPGSFLGSHCGWRTYHTDTRISEQR
jgi:DNA polymerase epsilon subunit 2